MLSPDENALLTQTNAGTPMGELFRRFWWPIFIPDELPQPDGDPVRTRLLGEDLVAFRDTNGKVGIVEAYCPHRRAPLFFGRNEACGLRCVYHGWKFDVSGNCVDMPSEPPESNFKDKVHIKAYPTMEWAGMVWVYMGPRDKLPEHPPELAGIDGSKNIRATKWIQECNYMQGVEGDIDTAHISFLHSDTSGENPGPAGSAPPSAARSAAKWPRLTALDTDYGMVYGGRRDTADGSFYWRVTQWMLPMYSLIPQGPGACTAWLPVDDHHCIRYNLGVAPGEGAPPRPGQFSPDPRVVVETVRGAYTFPDGGVMDTCIPVENKRNLYGLDRAWQKRGSFSGIKSIPTQDRAMTEGMGWVCDRSKEHLGTTDIAVITARRRLVSMARDLEKGIEPFAATHPEVFRVRALGIVSPEPTLEELLRTHADKVRPPVPA